MRNENQNRELIILKTIPKKDDCIEIAGIRGVVVDVIQNKTEFEERFTREIISDSRGFRYPRKRLSAKPGNLTIEIEFLGEQETK